MTCFCDQILTIYHTNEVNGNDFQIVNHMKMIDIQNSFNVFKYCGLVFFSSGKASESVILVIIYGHLRIATHENKQDEGNFEHFD